jgi:hypothetical protein
MFAFALPPRAAWIGNCVGHYNYKFFVCFLVWTVATCGFSMFLIIGRVTAMLDSSRPFSTVSPVTNAAAGASEVTCRQ